MGTPPVSAVHFGGFELDPKNGELRKAGLPVRLRPQALKVLTLLASRPSCLVTREEIQRELWGRDTFVDFQQGLNACVKQIRAALGDDPAKPRYLETVPRRGYRFIVPISGTTGPVQSEPPSPEVLVLSKVRRKANVSIAITLGTVLLGLGFVLARYSFRPDINPSTQRNMLAVLPFDNLDGEPEQEYFSDGLTEQIISYLGNLQPDQLGIIARTSVVQYKKTRKSIGEIGKETGANFILEGSVRRSGNRVRISAQLIRVRDQTHLWAESYDRDLRDILTLQSTVAQAIADEITLKLSPRAQAHLSKVRQVAPKAYEAYLRGRFFWNKRTEKDLRKALEYFHEAISLDASYAVAYSGMADCYNLLPDYSSVAPTDAFPRAKEAAIAALEIDENANEAHTSLAFAKMNYEWDWSGTEREFKRAIELNPNYATAHQWYAVYLTWMGRHDEAIGGIMRAKHLDPMSLVINTNVGRRFYFAREYDQAISQLRGTLELDANFGPAYYELGLAYEQKGMLEEAIPAFQKAVALSTDNGGVLSGLARAYAVAGRRADAEKALKRLTRLRAKKYISAYGIALVYEALGEKHLVFTWLQKAYEERAAEMPLLKVDPRLDSVRSDPRFEALQRKIGLSSTEAPIEKANTPHSVDQRGPVSAKW